MMRVLETTGAKAESTGSPRKRIPRSSQVKTHPTRVARVPKRISWGKVTPIKKPMVLVMRQPTVTPTPATGEKTGRRVRASETRNCTGPKERRGSASASTE